MDFFIFSVETDSLSAPSFFSGKYYLIYSITYDSIFL